MAILSASQQNELYTQQLTKMDERFRDQSYTEGAISNDFEWGDNHTINIPTVGHAALSVYNPSAAWNQRTGTVQEITDENNSYTVDQAYTFHATIDQVPSADQRFIRKMSNVLRDTTDFELKPLIDKYRLQAWADGAGQVMFGADKDMANTITAATGSGGDNRDHDIIRTIMKMNVKLTNNNVPDAGRVWYMSADAALDARIATRLQYNEGYTGKVLNGQIAHIDNSPIVALPTGYMPKGVDIMCKWKKASIDPRKGDKIRTLNNVVGSFMTHLEGLYRFDSFVLANKANGILLFTTQASNGSSTSICATPVVALETSGSPATATGKITITSSTSGAGVKYAVCPFFDTRSNTPVFKNPKLDKNATAYSSAIEFSADGVYTVAAYASKSGMTNSAIAVYKVTVVSGDATTVSLIQ